jgi:cytochrome c
MKTYLLAAITAGALIIASTPASAADAAHGQELFRAQCGVCHEGGEGDGGGGSGPSLRGVVGRKVGGDAAYGGYTSVLSDAKDKWTTDSLNTFLVDPNKDRSGTNMPISIKDDAERADIITYLATLK